MGSPSLVEENAAKLQELNEAVHARFRKRHLGPAEEESWREACRQLHASYDHLAFPGGLQRAMSLLPTGDSTTVEAAVKFLEVDPMFFRSGYIKEEVIKHLRQASFNDDQRKRLQGVIVARAHDKSDRRELKRYWRLARFVSDPAFELRIAGLATSSVRRVSERAKRTLIQIRSKG